MVVVVVAALYLAREVLIPITLAVLLSFVLAPVVDALAAHSHPARARRAPGRGVWLSSIHPGHRRVSSACRSPSVAADIPRYASTVEHKIADGRGAQRVGRITGMVDRLGKQVEHATPAEPPPSTSPETATAGSAAAHARRASSPPPSSPIELARTVLAPVLGPLGTTFIIFIVAVFILMQQEDLRDRMIRLVRLERPAPHDRRA